MYVPLFIWHTIHPHHISLKWFSVAISFTRFVFLSRFLFARKISANEWVFCRLFRFSCSFGSTCFVGWCWILLLLLLAIKQSCVSFCVCIILFFFCFSCLIPYFHSTPKPMLVCRTLLEKWNRSPHPHTRTNIFLCRILKKTRNEASSYARIQIMRIHTGETITVLCSFRREKKVSKDGKAKTKDRGEAYMCVRSTSSISCHLKQAAADLNSIFAVEWVNIVLIIISFSDHVRMVTVSSVSHSVQHARHTSHVIAAKCRLHSVEATESHTVISFFIFVSIFMPAKCPMPDAPIYSCIKEHEDHYRLHFIIIRC